MTSAEISISFLSDRFDSCINTEINDDLDRGWFVLSLMDFSDIHGDDALVDLCGFYLWCFDNIEDPDKRMAAIQTTFAHDIRNMRDRGFMPRSSGYSESFHKFFHRQTVQL